MPNARPLLPALALLLASLACTLTGAPATSTPAAGPNWSTYTNTTHGFSIDHPPEFQVPASDDPETFGRIGEQIFYNISDVNPADCRFYCQVIEDTSTVEVAGQTATRLSGYIGAIGGNIPQQYVTYVIPRAGRYYSFTLYALPSSATPSSNDIVPLDEADVALFEQMLATLTFSQ